MAPLRILTWHIHGSYLYYLAQARAEFYLPVKPGWPPRFGGRVGSPHWPDNVHDVPAGQVKDLDIDVVLFQARENYLEDQYQLLSENQRQLPRIYLEHDPPREVPSDTRHLVDDPNVLLVHVTHFNNLMWDSSRTPTIVIEHGVTVADEVHYRGDLERGIVVVNGLGRRGRRLGADVFQHVRDRVPLDLVGMHSEDMDGLGEVRHDRLPAFTAQYRFFFNPIRYTSLGLAVCEAMMVGLPIIGLATTEMVTAVENGVNGYVHTDVNVLVDRMRQLLRDPSEAQRLSVGARRIARERFDIRRFARDWEHAFALVTNTQWHSGGIPHLESRPVSSQANA